MSQSSKSRRATALAVAMFLSLALGACGNGDKSTNEGASDKPTNVGTSDKPTNEVASDKPTFYFSAIPSESDATGYVAKFKVVANYLTKTLDVPFEYRHATSYPASVRMFENEEILLAWFGGLTGVQARHRVAGANAIAQGIEDPNYFSYFIAHKDTGLERSDSFPTGIKGRSFTFGSAQSTSGRLMPEYFIRNLGGSAPKEYFKSVGFAKGHNATALTVQSGQVEVGALSYKTYDTMVANGEIDPKVCKVIWKTPGYADYNFTAHPKIDAVYGEGFTVKLQAAILAMKGDDLLKKPFGRSGMIKATNKDFDAILGLAKNLGKGFLGE